MTLRSEMVGLAELLGRKVDPAGALDLDADVLQDHLDRHVSLTRAIPLAAITDPLTGHTHEHVWPATAPRYGLPTNVPTFPGVLPSFPGFTGDAWLADDAILRDNTGTLVTPDSADPLRGIWKFTADRLGPFYVDGERYDVLAAGADLAEALATMAARGIIEYQDAAGEKFKRGDAAGAFRDLAASFRRSMPVGSTSIRQGEARSPWPNNA